MVILPLSPIGCALVTTMLFAVTFYAGRWWGNEDDDEPNREGNREELRELMTKSQSE